MFFPETAVWLARPGWVFLDPEDDVVVVVVVVVVVCVCVCLFVCFFFRSIDFLN